ncbi:spore cortex biosynthesis protein YabQ [Desulforamulus hydrothermalis]|uniref:spore cortex biosynthesis protein YabQ n=1 Tax=Desulforamulus hydrothermalis TaxID=412895 RepID=UPI0002EAC39A|nr:spore cortex biosynthesis protein YabQ [Desulforamulus hydrothermalis]SHH00747.1 spore cortex biosynthesis protein YabQ [Desulforamulus hydrothermalis Lam5 = DSM 18033]
MVPLMEQFYYFALTIAIGMVAGFCYDLYRVTRGTLKLRRFGTALGDLLFWLVLTGVVFVLLLLGNWGEVRLYVLLGLALGASVYLNLFSRRTVSVIRWTFRQILQIWHGLIKGFCFVRRLLCLPFRGIYLLIAVPLGLAAGLTGKTIQKSGQILNKLLGVPYRHFKNACQRRLSAIFTIFEYKDPE